MAVDQTPFCVSINANADLSSYQYCFVSLINSSGEARVRLANNSERTVGVLYNDPAAAGRAATVAIGGIVKVKAGAAITAGAAVCANGVGRAISTISSTDFESGIALTTASNDGDIIDVLLQHVGIT